MPFLLVAAALLLGACGTISTTPPAATPADYQGIFTEFAKRGLTVDGTVAGDAGCPDSKLVPTAIAFNAKGLDQADAVRIYLYIFADRATYERLRTSVDTCARSYVTDPDTFASVEQSPFVLAGQGPWAPKFEAALREGLEVAAGTGD